jgi:hypothetical protein
MMRPARLEKPHICKQGRNHVIQSWTICDYSACHPPVNADANG